MNPRIIFRTVVYTVGVVSPGAINIGGCVQPSLFEFQVHALAHTILEYFTLFWLIIAVICLGDLLLGILRRIGHKKARQKRKLLGNPAFWILIALAMLGFAIVILYVFPDWFTPPYTCAL